LANLAQLLSAQTGLAEGGPEWVLQQTPPVDGGGSTSAGRFEVCVAVGASPERMDVGVIHDLAGKTQFGGIASGARRANRMKRQANQRFDELDGQGDSAKNSQRVLPNGPVDPGEWRPGGFQRAS
jgi:hypothetical protein